jgi:hypothetical protein
MTYAHPFATRKGRRLRQVKLRSEPRCEACLRERRATEAVTVHDIKPISERGDPSAWDNLESACGEHHKRIHGCSPEGADRPEDRHADARAGSLAVNVMPGSLLAPHLKVLDGGHSALERRESDHRASICRTLCYVTSRILVKGS